MKYKNIIFDFDGTLVDTEYALLHSLQDTLKAFSINKDLKELSFVFGIPGGDALKQLGVNDISGALEIWYKNMVTYKESIIIFDGIKEALKMLLEGGYELGIVTSKTRKEFKFDFDCSDIKNFFKYIVCSDDTVQHKPDPEPLLKYMELANVKPQEVLYIGDSKYDAMCAEQAHIDFGLAVWGHHKRDLPAAYYFDKPIEIFQKLI